MTVEATFWGRMVMFLTTAKALSPRFAFALRTERARCGQVFYQVSYGIMHTAHFEKVECVKHQSKPELTIMVANREGAILGERMARWDDTRLIQACLLGDDYAWEMLIERYSRLIYTIPLRFGFSHLMADEIFQEICLILLEKLGTLRDRQRLSAWLVTVTRRACIQRLRHKVATTSIDTLGGDNLADDILEDKLLRLEQQHLVHCAIEYLDSRCQRLLRALFFEVPPLSYESVARELGVSVGSVGPTRARCLEKLKQEIVKLEQ